MPQTTYDYLISTDTANGALNETDFVVKIGFI